jgi:hypothetical protein
VQDGWWKSLIHSFCTSFRLTRDAVGRHSRLMFFLQYRTFTRVCDRKLNADPPCRWHPMSRECHCANYTMQKATRHSFTLVIRIDRSEHSIDSRNTEIVFLFQPTTEYIWKYAIVDGHSFRRPQRACFVIISPQDQKGLRLRNEFFKQPFEFFSICASLVSCYSCFRNDFRP